MTIADRIAEALRSLPPNWEGKSAIVEMRDSGSRQWKQMEWMGFFFEYLCGEHLRPILEMPGPSYGKAEFDAFGEIPWDFKAHASNTSSHEVIINDAEAISLALEQYGSIGVIIAVGEVVYNDEDRSFQAWHEQLKGGPSKYTRDREKRGAWSRLRKQSLNLDSIHILQLTESDLERAGKSFQKGFRNADGSSRRKKLVIDLEKVDECIVETVSFRTT